MLPHEKQIQEYEKTIAKFKEQHKANPLLSEAELRKMILNGSETYTLLYFIGTAGILLSVILISRKFPVRLLKPIYFCPADMRLKRKSLRSYFWSKVSFCLILFVLLCLSFTGNLLIFF